MTNEYKPRLRFFEASPGQRHIRAEDRYLYAHDAPGHSIGIIGTGTIGQEHMRVATLLGRARVHGIYDEAPESMDVAIGNFESYAAHSPVRYDSLEAACDDPATNALMICTPNFTHIDVFEVAARTGKPIFLEKPMATTVEDAKRIVELANGNESFVQVGLQYRYKAPYVEARHEVLERRSLGNPCLMSMCEYRPPFLDKVRQWNKFARYSGGTLVEKCCHYFDLLNLLADAAPERVFASGGQAVNFTTFERDGEAADIDDHALVIIDYENGVRANFTLSMFAPWFHEELVVTGDAGRLVAVESFNFYKDEVARSHVSIEHGENGARRETDLAYSKDIDCSGHHGATFYEHVAFMDQLDGKATESATPLQGLWSIIVASAAQESIETGQPVQIKDLVARHALEDILEG